MAATWPCKAKITVLRREYHQDLADEYLADPGYGKCSRFADGQEFVVDKEAYLRLLDGSFCSEAWAAVSGYVYTALQGGSPMAGYTNDERVMIACCNDGVRPVIFKIERID